MTKDQKLSFSRWLLFSWSCFGAGLAIWVTILHPYNPNTFPFNPQSTSMSLIGAGISTVFIVGLFIGTRGIGEALTLRQSLNLILRFPGWIPWVVISLVAIYYSI